MPKNKYYNAQDDVVQIVNGERKAVRPYNMYAALHQDPLHASAAGDLSRQASASAKPLPPEEERKMPYFRFDGAHMTLVEKVDGAVLEHPMDAVSGRPNPDGTFSYDKERQNAKNEGPIPEGKHTLDLQTIRYVKDAGVLNRVGSVAADILGKKFGKFPGGDKIAWGLGSVDIELDPQVAQESGRRGITAHGGGLPGSAGCIDLGNDDAAFFEHLEKLKKDHNQIDLYVDYSHTPDKVQWKKNKYKEFLHALLK